MKKFIAMVVALMFAFSLTAAFAADKAAETKAATVPAKDVKKSAAKKHQLTGEVKAVDAQAATLTIKGKKEMTFSADEKLLKNVKIGDKIVVTYTESDGKANVTSIKAAKESKKAQASKEEKKADPIVKPAAKDITSGKKKNVEGC